MRERQKDRQRDSRISHLKQEAANLLIWPKLKPCGHNPSLHVTLSGAKENLPYFGRNNWDNYLTLVKILNIFLLVPTEKFISECFIIDKQQIWILALVNLRPQTNCSHLAQLRFQQCSIAYVAVIISDPLILTWMSFCLSSRKKRYLGATLRCLIKLSCKVLMQFGRKPPVSMENWRTSATCGSKKRQTDQSVE